MSHLWVRTSGNGHRDWAIVRLDAAGAGFTLVQEAMPVQRRASLSRELPALVVDRADAQRDVWVLLAGHDDHVRVNGLGIEGTGIHVLKDKDEIILPWGERLFFSTEELPQIVEFKGSQEPTFCPRCKQFIAAGDLVVRCPQCRVWYHQKAERLCWTYHEACVGCKRRTDMSAGYAWMPGQIA